MRLTASFTFTVVAAGTFAACAAPQVDVAAETEAVRARSDGVVAAEVAFDVAAVLAFWADDAIVQGAGVPQIQGKPAIGELYGQYFESGILKEFSGTRTHLEVSAAGDLAYEYGVNKFVMVGPEGDLLDIGKYLGIWKKIDGEWFIVALAFTSDAPAPVPMARE
ncbi:MAG: nuclear transport factor 2 family protein [Gemmatimonadota bacterium]|nr:MAG: nuclear transport factor 2 family protein [Gemmatimonadota bacterium]